MKQNASKSQIITQTTTADTKVNSRPQEANISVLELPYHKTRKSQGGYPIPRREE